jgi:hypothetical protein
MEPGEMPERAIRLEIVIARDCPGCAEARAIAQDLQGRFPALEVDVIEFDSTRQIPSQVVATPTYLLNGRVISLGNPRRAWLVQEIRRYYTAYTG